MIRHESERKRANSMNSGLSGARWHYNIEQCITSSFPLLFVLHSFSLSISPEENRKTKSRARVGRALVGRSRTEIVNVRSRVAPGMHAIGNNRPNGWPSKSEGERRPRRD